MIMNDAEHAKMCYQSPAFWLEEMTGIVPTDQQRQMMDAIAYSGAHVAVASGHGIGKSTALATCALWFLSTREDATIPCTAPTAHQLEDILWFEIRRIIDRMSPWMKSQYIVTKDKVTMVGSNGSIIARTARPEKPDALQGFHNKELLFILDEAAGIDERVYEVAHGALSTPKARVLATGNPTSLTGFFHKIFHSENNWNTFNFSSIDSPLVDLTYSKVVAADYGVDSDAYRVRVLGEFPLSGKNALIPRDTVKAALARHMTEDEAYRFGAVLGVDPAWEGDDRSVIALRQGRYAKILFVGHKLDGNDLAANVSRLANAHNAQYIFVDKTGVGASCCDFLRMREVDHIRVYFNMVPDDKDTFINKRIEMWWRMRKWMEEDDVTLINHEGLLEDLTAPEYGVRDNGKTYMESKEEMRRRGIRSPDLGDALALTFYLPYEVTNRKRSSNNAKVSQYVEQHRRKWRETALGYTNLYSI